MAGLKFRVVLDSVKNGQVFRDILINDDFNFEQFYYTIVDAFDFSDNKMASFYVSNFDWDKGEEICLVDMSFDSEETAEVALKEMNQLQIRERILEENQHFILLHDYLEMWIFLIELIEVTEDIVDHPILLMEVGEVPPELLEKERKTSERSEFETPYEIDDNDFYDAQDDDNDFDLDFDDEDFDDYGDDFGGYDDIDDFDY